MQKLAYKYFVHFHVSSNSPISILFFKITEVIAFAVKALVTSAKAELSDPVVLSVVLSFYQCAEFLQKYNQPVSLKLDVMIGSTNGRTD